ncbi:MAG: hypothetical protein AABY79_11815 [Nitrospirota bacterium]|jgi:hypothetical protein
MSKTLELTPAEIRKAGWNALKARMGIAGALKFILQYEKGEGDYTKLRKELFKEETVDSLIEKMKKEGRIKAKGGCNKRG